MLQRKQERQSGIAVDFRTISPRETGLTIEYIGITDPEEYRSVILNDQADIIFSASLFPSAYGTVWHYPYAALYEYFTDIGLYTKDWNRGTERENGGNIRCIRKPG